MKNKELFITFLTELLNHDKEFAKTIYTDEIKECIEYIQDMKETTKPLLTDKGKALLSYLVTNNIGDYLTAKDIAERMEINSRSASGTLNSLNKNGFVESTKPEGKTAKLYRFTELGKETLEKLEKGEN